MKLINMSTNIVMSDKKKALIAYKEKILKELAYYESRIEEISSSRSKSSLIEDNDSSDSEPEFPLTIDLGPSVWQLKQQQSSLKTCLQATQELTSLQVLQSEVNVLVDDPVIEGEPPVTEEGVWREVTAECKVDLVPFSISFYVHQPSRKFAPLQYRGARTTPVRAPHAAELDHSVLPAVGTPSDAVEVLKNYASAHRARRSTLARLAATYNDALHMEPMPEGGYLLKCANLLEVSWMLQNKWSPIAPFHHRMKFNLEYMDESYIKIITQAHRQLSDPTIETDERTFLLSKIISTCLEAQGPTQELYESMSSDPETTQSLKKQKTTLYQEPEQPIVTRNKSKEVMAPPKSLPKKTKPKGKENVVENRKTKRVTEDTGKAKKFKDQNNDLLKSVDNLANEDKKENAVDEISPKNKEVTTTNIAKPKKSENIKKPEVKSTENNKIADKVKSTIEKTDSDKNDVKNKPNTNNEKTKVVAKVKKNVENIATTKDVNKAKAVVSSKKIVSSDAKKDVKSTKSTDNNENTKKALTKETVPVEKSDKIVKNKVVKPTDTENLNNNKEKKETLKTIAAKQKNADENTNKIVKKVTKENNNVNKNKPEFATTKTQSTNKNKIAEEKVKSVASTNKVTTNVEQGLVKKKVDNAKTKPVNAKQNKPSKSVENKIVSNEETNQEINKETTIEKTVEKNDNSLKRKNNLADGDTNVAVTKKPKLSKPESSHKEINNEKNKPQNLKISNKIVRKVEQNKPKFITNSMKTLKPGNIHRAFNAGNISKQSSDKPSKIPQKKLSSTSEAALKKNPLRISPRKIPSKFKTPAPFGNKYTMVQKTTSIPRFMKKPSPKM